MFKFNNNQRICYLWSVCLNLKKELMDNSWIIHRHSCLKSTSTSGFSYLWSLNTNYHELSINFIFVTKKTWRAEAIQVLLGDIVLNDCLFRVSHRACFADNGDFHLSGIRHLCLDLVGNLAREFLCLLVVHLVGTHDYT